MNRGKSKNRILELEARCGEYRKEVEALTAERDNVAAERDRYKLLWGSAVLLLSDEFAGAPQNPFAGIAEPSHPNDFVE